MSGVIQKVVVFSIKQDGQWMRFEQRIEGSEGLSHADVQGSG